MTFLKKNKIYLIAAFIFVVGTLLLTWTFMKYNKTINKIESSILRYTNNYNKLNDSIEELEQFKSEHKNLESEVNLGSYFDIANSIINQEDIIIAFQELSTKVGFKIRNLEFLEQNLNSDSKEDNINNRRQTSSDIYKLDCMRVKISGTGTYEQFVEFIDRLKNHEKKIFILEFEIIYDEQSGEYIYYVSTDCYAFLKPQESVSAEGE